MSISIIFEAQKLTRMLREICTLKQHEAGQLAGYEKVTLAMDRTSNGREYYRVRNRSKSATRAKAGKRNLYNQRYLGKASDLEVKKIKRAHFLKAAIATYQHNIEVLENMICEFMDFDDLSINQRLPLAYRDGVLSSLTQIADPRGIEWMEKALAIKAKYTVPNPEGLKYETCDGTLVRSKSEVIIYNYLKSLGIFFVYEFPVVTPNGILWPDFLILSEIDYQEVIMLEHFGMMDNEAYSANVGNKINNYMVAHYEPGKDVFFTFENKEIGVNTSRIYSILKEHVRVTL